MKKFKRLLLVAAITLGAVNAEAKIINFGVLAGSTSTFYDAKNYDSDAIENTTGFHLGASAAITLPFLSVTPEFIYTNSRFNIVDREILNTTSDITVNAIDIPVVVGLSLFGPIKVEFGPNFSVYNKAKGTFYSDLYDDYDFGRTQAKVGYIVGLKGTFLKKFSVGVRFNGQFDRHTATPDIHGTPYEFDLDYKALSFTAGFKF